MTTMKRSIGKFGLPSGQDAVGELSLAGSNTLLTLHSDEFMPNIEQGTCLRGVAYNGDKITLVDCSSSGTGHTTVELGPTKYHADVFPHYVLVGRIHLDPAEACITGVHFTTNDLTSLFYDFDAFSHVLDARPIIDVVLSERRALRPVDAGEHPQVFYFTGKDRITEVQTILGKISVNHRPSFNMGGPSGVYIRNRIEVSIEPDSPVSFDEAMSRMYDVCTFLSFSAGRAQGLDHVAVTTIEMVNGHPQGATVHQSYKWKSGNADEFTPHPADVESGVRLAKLQSLTL